MKTINSNNYFCKQVFFLIFYQLQVVFVNYNNFLSEPLRLKNTPQGSFLECSIDQNEIRMEIKKSVFFIKEMNFYKLRAKSI